MLCRVRPRNPHATSRTRMIGLPIRFPLGGCDLTQTAGGTWRLCYVFLSDSLPHPPASLARYLGAMVSTSIRHVGIVRSYARGSEIVHEYEPANCAYEVLSGTVCTSKTLREGGPQVTGFYFPGDVFGLESAKKHSVAAQAIQRSASGFQKTSVDLISLVQS
jgi:Cyclic nucleotide-binding domain